MVYVILGNGFEEIEALTPVDVLRRCGVEVCTAGVGGLKIEGSHGIIVTADCMVDEIDQSQLDMIVLPGGLGGVNAISASAPAMEAIRRAYEDGKHVAAICAGPTVLASLGITDGKHATSYPSAKEKMSRAIYEESPVVTDGKLTTSRGPGTSMAFGLELARILCGDAVADQVAHDMLVF
jgi:4-methyl-5(b-hydroxyethyl)-thiazole monophosphate biosynthesis